ncbi:MAG: hypothetical protein EXR86_14025 [Gammaproteobacteria bacterium]|nr:hypothetical protein [Gammaproteobacteria bacterium]
MDPISLDRLQADTALTTWKAHTLTSDRDGIPSLSVTRNRRLTFRIDTFEREINDVNLEDHH